MLRKTLIGLLALVVALGVEGCGGGGSSASSGGGGGGAGPANAYLFMTGAKNSNYDHVWVTVTNVGLVNASGQTTTVYDGSSSGGQVVDLNALAGASGQQYLLLTAFSAPSGMYKSAKVTVNSNLSVVLAGNTNAASAKFAGATGTSTVLSASLGTSQTIGSNQDVVLEFNEANWSLAPIIHEGGRDGVNRLLPSSQGPFARTSRLPVGFW